MREVNYVALGKRIKEWRKLKKMNQYELSRKAEISSSFFGHIERGTRKASIETLLRLAEALGVTPDVLLQDSIDYKESRLTVAPDNAAFLVEIQKMIEEQIKVVSPVLSQDKNCDDAK